MSDPQIRLLYQSLLSAWNHQDAAGMAACYTEDGSQVGFDGSQINGRSEDREQLTRELRQAYRQSDAA